MGDKKPLDTVKDGGNGRPEVSDLQYEMWVTAMAPWLRMGSTIRRALTMAGLTQHKSLIHKRYQEGGWFMDRIDELRSRLGEAVNETISKIVDDIAEKVKQDRPVTDTDLKALALGMKHRTSQPFFVDRQETAEAKPSDFGKVVDTPSIEYVNPVAAPADVKEEKHAKETSAPVAAPADDQVRADAPATPSVETPH